jgi:hypothetical protein
VKTLLQLPSLLQVHLLSRLMLGNWLWRRTQHKHFFMCLPAVEYTCIFVGYFT